MALQFKIKKDCKRCSYCIVLKYISTYSDAIIRLHDYDDLRKWENMIYDIKSNNSSHVTDDYHINTVTIDIDLTNVIIKSYNNTNISSFTIDKNLFLSVADKVKQQLELDGYRKYYYKTTIDKI